MSKKDDVPRYESTEPEEGGLSRNAIMHRYGLGPSRTEPSPEEQEMLAWEEAQAAKLAAADEVQEALRTGTRLHPSKVALSALAHNPFNPRMELLELKEKAQSFREKGQLQPLLVCTRSAFLAAHPGQEESLGDAIYVVIDGNRRLAAAHLAGLETLRIDVNDALASSAADILEAALIANVQRVDVPPLEEAKALQQLVAFHGSQQAVAKRLGKSKMWVSQRLALLGLTDELQDLVQTGELKVEPARRIGRLPEDQQAGEAEKAIRAVSPPRQRRRGDTKVEPAAPSGVNAVYSEPPVEGSAEGPAPAASGVNGVYPAAPDSSADAEAGDSQPKKLPYDDPLYVVRHLEHKMDDQHFVMGARVWMTLLRERHPGEYRALLEELTEQQST